MAAYLNGEDYQWFSLDRYDDLRSFSLQEWVELLAHRAHVATYLRIPARTPIGNVEELLGPESFQFLPVLPIPPTTIGDIFEHFARQLTETPLAQLLNTEIGDEDFVETNTTTVKSVDVETVQHIVTQIPAGSLNTLPIDLIARERSLSLDGGPKAHISVDLWASNEQLVEDFKRWLTSWRNVTGKVRNDDYRSAPSAWLTEHLIPFIDVKMYAALRGSKVKLATVHKVIFPEINLYKWDKKKDALGLMAKQALDDATICIISHESRNQEKSNPKK